MEIICGKYSGFCFGVKRAVDAANSEIYKNEGKVYCLGEIVHNEKVVSSLKNKGMITIDKIEDAENGSKVIIRAHGEKEKNV